MRKIYAFLAAALMSVSVFAAKDVVPSDAVLADYYNQGDVCVCIYVPGNMACNDIILAGSFHKEGTSWITSPVSDLPHFEPVEGYDGWYVASFEPEAEPDAEKGMQAKPVMLDVDGNFNWEFQVGAATVIRGGVQVVAGFSGEIDLINYGADAPNVFTVDAWKQNPCDATYHNYTITVVSDGCGGYVVPFVIGAMNSWTFEQMQLDVAKSQEYGVPTYYYSKKMAEGTPYQIVSGLMDNQGVVPAAGDSAPAWNDIAYMQKLVDEVWGRIPGEQGDNQLTHENAEIVWDLRAEDLRWARCAPAEPAEYVVSLLISRLRTVRRLLRSSVLSMIGRVPLWSSSITDGSLLSLMLRLRSTSSSVVPVLGIKSSRFTTLRTTLGLRSVTTNSYSVNSGRMIPTRALLASGLSWISAILSNIVGA